MTDYEALIQEALDAGFSKAGIVETAKLKFLSEVRKMCEVNACGAYGTNWACPPACGGTNPTGGTVEGCEAKVKSFEKGIVVETIGQLEDSFDIEGMTAAAKEHRERLEKMASSLKERYAKVLPLTAGGCSKCQKCTYPDAPCRFPDTLIAPMEGLGLMVSDVCRLAGIPYINGANTVTYIGCFFVE